MKVLIITGGNSSERDISLLSAANVKNSLEKNGHHVTLFDFKNGYSELEKLIKDFDVVFPVMHGKEGEDGSLYQFLKTAGIPYIGSDPKGAKVAFDKILFKKYCEENDIPSAEWEVIKNKDDIKSFGFPCVLKAANGGSSREVALLNDASDLESELVNQILALSDEFYVETLLKGVEITVGVLINKPLPVIEIVPPKTGWFDYKNKYSGQSQEIPFAPSVKPAIQKSAQEIALKIHIGLNLVSFSRTDFMVVDDKLYILEANTPGGVGLTAQSLFPKMAKAAGIDYLEELLKSAT